MPSKSGSQHRLMCGVSHGMKPKGGKGPTKKVADEYCEADKRLGKHFKGKK